MTRQTLYGATISNCRERYLIQMSLPHWTSLSLYTVTNTHTQDMWKSDTYNIPSVLLPLHTYSYSQGKSYGIYFLRRSSGILPDLVTDLVVGEPTSGTHPWHLAFFAGHMTGSRAYRSRVKRLEYSFPTNTHRLLFF